MNTSQKTHQAPSERHGKLKKIVLGLSGGVDSAVSAVLLKEAGYEVHTVYIECWNEPGCRAEDDRKDALSVALKLNLPFQVLDFKTLYKEKVMGYFLSEYKAGRTPNPDVMCNKIIKFGLFYDWAMQQGYEAIATGHYASTDGETLSIPVDEHKDQTYFLYQIIQEQLPHIVFPLQNLTKDEVRKRAESENLLVAQKKDSVGICFVGDINVPKFLRDNLGEKPGNIIDETGHILGEHKGLWFHTVGQRHGFTYDKKKYLQLHPENERGELPALYVIAKKPLTNELVIGTQRDSMQDTFTVENFHGIGFSQADLLKNEDLTVRIRHTGERVPCTAKEEKTSKNSGKSSLKIYLSRGVQGIASGQSAVFYVQKDDRILCVGGGIIL